MFYKVFFSKPWWNAVIHFMNEFLHLVGFYLLTLMAWTDVFFSDLLFQFKMSKSIDI